MIEKMNETPHLGEHRIRRVDVVGGFLDGMEIDLVEGLNCIIGARGTGKTTILELVRYAVGQDSRDPSAARRIERLVAQNLNGGRVRVHVRTRDGMAYTVSRSPGEEPVVLAEDGSPTDVNIASGGLFRCDIFSQNEVESIADQSCSQLSIIDNFEPERIQAADRRIDALRADLDANASRIIPLQQKLLALDGELSTCSDVELKLKAFGAEGGSNADAINQAHALKALRDREARAIRAGGQALDQARQALEPQRGALERQLHAIFARDMLEGPNAKAMESIQGDLGKCAADLDGLLRDCLATIARTRESVLEKARQLALVHKKQDMAFQELIEKHKEAQAKATERSQLERRRNELLACERQRQQIDEQLSTLRDQRQQLLDELSEARNDRFEIRRSIVERINGTLSPSIRVSLVQFGNPERYSDLLTDALRGNRLQHGRVAAKIVNAFWPGELAEVVLGKDAESLIRKAELNADQASKVLAALNDPQLLFDLEVVELADRPTIELNDGGVYKESSSLSTGQKCTAILPILLMDSASPLLIDQPEDNLDNRFVYEAVVDSIAKVKQRRQLIFVTHNPNIPVLGEADRVFVLESDGTVARKRDEGTVDQCRSQIVTLLEGGEEAFQRRRAKYQY